MRLLVCIVVSVSLMTTAALAQIGPSVNRGAPYSLSVDVDLVLLNVTVLDRKGHPVSGLKPENFHVYEDGVLQQIRSFRPEDLPATIGIVIDNSGSMTSKRGEVISAALAFVSSANPNDELFLVNFNDSVTLPRFGSSKVFTNSYPDLRQALLEMRTVGRTALYDGIVAALQQLGKGSHLKKALVILSDGGDNASTSTMDDVLRWAKESTATLYTIGFYDPGDKDRNPKLLRRLSALTGGDSYVANNFHQLQNVWLKVAGGIRSQYTIGYVSTNAKHDGLFRNVKIVVRDSLGKPLQVRTRAGYLASRSAVEIRP
jgi:Ca-activated chloride channel homolog